MTQAKGILLEQLAFTGPNQAFAELRFHSGANLIYGASNTGKSFARKALDFMLGGQDVLPDIKERQKYDRVLLGLKLPDGERVTLFRSMQGGPFTMVDGAVLSMDAGRRRVLAAKHDAKRDDNLSNFLLKSLGLQGLQIAKDLSGTKRSLSFRDLVPFCVVDETAIQSENSPAESGEKLFRQEERSVFKLLLTGHDDSAMTTIMKPSDRKKSRSAKLELVTDMLAAIEAELAADFPDAQELSGQSERLDGTLAELRNTLEGARGSVRELLDRKRKAVAESQQVMARRAEIALNLERFRQLDAVYASDIDRLSSLEESSFLLLLRDSRNCPVCGAEPGAQKHQHAAEELKFAREAALAEIEKILRQKEALQKTVEQLHVENAQSGVAAENVNLELENVDTLIAKLTPEATSAQQQFDQVIKTRDGVRRGIDLLNRKQALEVRKVEFSSRKIPAEPRPQLGPQSTVTHEFAQTVRDVLVAWQFPGDKVIVFDDATFDIKIDGKRRRDNGKGVRAVLHAAFKVALMLHCRSKGLPHPGFLVLDSPLVTYRDPLASNSDPLSADELALQATALKQHFFNHLHTIGGTRQIVVLENIDPPANILSLANVYTFTGSAGQGRAGLL